MKLVNKKELFEKWIGAYDTRLKPAIHIGDFTFFDKNKFAKWKKMQLKTYETLWGGEPAGNLLTNYLNPEILTIYTDENKQKLIPQFGLIPTPNGNVRIYKKFWKDKFDSKIVPPLLVYADLINTGDKRCIETAGYINFSDKFDAKISIHGFQEAYENSVMTNISGEELKVASLSGLCILKLIAWADKPFERETDIQDISNIIQHFFDIESEEIYRQHLDLFEGDDFDKMIAGARVLGRQINKTLSSSVKVKKLIIEILEPNIQDAESSRIGTIIAKDLGITAEKSVFILKELLNGLND
ncbi:MAG: type IV toxin-antitoxin system AbiEi family antitoxin [Bacteroidales bacterium]|jgi:hypothetical protein